MTCNEIAALVTDYLEGALPEADHARLEEHVSACRPCAVRLEQMRITVRLVGRLRGVRPS